jgi:hypothetical protein
MITHPALITVTIAEREREAARRRLLAQARASRSSRRRRDGGRRRRLRDLFRRPRPVVGSGLRLSAPWRS